MPGGIGAHANWMVTFDLGEIKATNFSGATVNHYSFSGSYDRVTQSGNDNGSVGIIYIDGVLAKASNIVYNNDPAYDMSITNIPNTARFLTLVITDGNDSSDHDDAAFINPVLNIH